MIVKELKRSFSNEFISEFGMNAICDSFADKWFKLSGSEKALLVISKKKINRKSVSVRLALFGYLEITKTNSKEFFSMGILDKRDRNKNRVPVHVLLERNVRAFLLGKRISKCYVTLVGVGYDLSGCE